MVDNIFCDIKRDADYIIKKVAGNDTQIDSIEKWGIGALNSCYKISIKNSLKKFFLKIENDDILPSTRRGQIAREVKGIEIMNSIGISCPTLLHYDCYKQDIGKKYILEEFIENDLLWEVKDSLTMQENEHIKAQITDILDKMKSIRSDYFGDIYENGAIGQYLTWKEAYLAMWKMLLNDAMLMNLFNEEEINIVSSVGEYALNQLIAPYSASFYHGDLGKHNVLTNYTDGFKCIGTVIDFGNSVFLPSYMNEDMTRKYGGWDVEVINMCEKYSINEAEYGLNNLVCNFESTIFSSMLALKRGNDPKHQTYKFLESCKQCMQIK